MNIKVYYLAGETDTKFKSYLEEKHQNATFYKSKIADQDFSVYSLLDQNSKFTRILNTREAIEISYNREAWTEILNYNSIKSHLEKSESYIKAYDVLIFDLHCISILSRSMKSSDKSQYVKESQNLKIVSIAKSCMHLLGLDLGVVTIGINTRRQYKVMNINPSPKLREKDISNLASKIINMMNRDERISQIDIKIGADPEFMIFNSKNGKLISASQFFPREGIVGCDNIRIPNRQQRPIAELRPKPDYSPLELTNNIRSALRYANRLANYRYIKWLAGSQPMRGYSIGGHIHFSNIRLNGSLLRALDNFIGLIVFMIENPNTAVKRRKKYGALGDYRIKDHGGFEYRTPGSWLVSQKITTAVLCLAKIVISRYPLLPYNYLNNPEAQQAFYNGQQDYFRSIFTKLWQHIVDLDIYSEYRDELQILPEMIEKEIIWDENSDFRKSWRLGRNKNEDISDLENRFDPATYYDETERISHGSRQDFIPDDYWDDTSMIRNDRHPYMDYPAHSSALRGSIRTSSANHIMINTAQNNRRSRNR
jgi:hypothetical protein